jgi:hypothetical protein
MNTFADNKSDNIVEPSSDEFVTELLKICRHYGIIEDRNDLKEPHEFVGELLKMCKHYGIIEDRYALKEQEDWVRNSVGKSDWIKTAKCFKCKLIGHLANACPTTGGDGNPPAAKKGKKGLHCWKCDAKDDHLSVNCPCNTVLNYPFRPKV